jgi:hypothetical protein
MSQSKRGGIVKLGYVTSFVPALGQTSNDMLGDVPDDQRVDIRIDVRTPLASMDQLY